MWLNLSPEPVFAVLHTPRSPTRQPVAALILPPFGWDGDFSYRPRRDWATKLAESGVTALRIDFPGTENSVGSPLAPDRFQSWITATVAAASWLRQESGCDRLVAIGIGLGGQVAHEAVAAGAAIDDLVLWAVRATGRAYLRELRAHAAVFTDPADSAQDAARVDIASGLGGHVMSTETATAINALKLDQGERLPHAELRRVLLLGRDAHGVDQKLRAHFEASGAALTVREVDDYRCLVGLPELMLAPTATISASIDWLLETPPASLSPIPHLLPASVPETLQTVEMEHEGVRIRERIVSFQTTSGRLIGIVSEQADGPQAPYCVTVLNSGSLRHTGPYRIFVDVARNAAATGVPTLRFDLPGLGDSDGSSLKIFERSTEDNDDLLTVLPEVYDHLQRLGVASRFVPAGLCLGGYLAIRATLLDRRAVAAISVNPPALKWTDVQRLTLIRGVVASSGPDGVAGQRAGHSRSKRLPRRISAIVDRAVHARYWIEATARRELAKVDLLWRLEHRGDIREITGLIDLYGATGARIFFAFSEDEMLTRMFARPKLARRLERWPQIKIEYLPTSDHNLGPRWVREILLGLLSEELRELRLLSSEKEIRSSV